MRLIDADAFAGKIKEISSTHHYDKLLINKPLTVQDVLDSVIAELNGTGLDGFENCPTVEERTTAEWIIRKEGDSLFVECSKCHRSFGDSPQGFIQWVINNFEYCPKCGSKMKVGTTKEVKDKEYKVKVITRGNCMICGKKLTNGLFFCKECREKANSRK